MNIFTWKVLLCFAFLLGLSKLSLAGDVPTINNISSGQDEYGIYIQFKVTSRDRGEDDEPWVSNANVYVTYTDDQGVQRRRRILQYYNSSNGDDDRSTNGIVVHPYITGARERADNGDQANNTWSGFVPKYGKVKKTDGGADLMQAWVRWYLPDYMVGKYLSFHADIVYGDDTHDDQTADFSGTINYPSTYRPDFSFSPSKTAGNVKITYKYNEKIGKAKDADYYYTIQHYMDNNTNDMVTDNTNTAPTGSLDVGMNNSPEWHNFHTRFIGKDEHMTYTRSQRVLVPAYVWPQNSNFKSAYNHNDANRVKLIWSVVARDADDAIGEDNFEIERSTDKTFAKNVKSVAKVKYEYNERFYTVYDDVTDIQGGTHLYYRLRRTKSKTDWGWNVLRTTDVVVETNTTQIADTVKLINSNGTPKAEITWQPFRGVWITGTKFSLKKTNKTTGSLAGTIDLTEEQARSGRYVDENIRYCNEFTYSIVVTLGNNYPSPPETDVPGSVLAVNIGTISGLTAAKGYFPDRTELRWHTEGGFDNYIIKRKVYGSSDKFVQIATIPGSSTSDLQTDDSKGAPGVYYQYMVVGAVKCNNTLKYSQDTLYAIGFRSPTGNIYGRVTYENGQAVEDVAVRLRNNDHTQMGQSIYLNGNADSYLKLDSLRTPFADSAFTVEAWIRPDDAAPKSQVIFSRGGQYELGFDAAGQLYFSYNGVTVSGDYFNKNNTYVHIAGIHGRNALTLMINDSVIAETACAPSTSHPDKTVYIGRNNDGSNYKGYIDEMLVWNSALNPAEIAKNYTLLLTGGEQGLVAYWRFDETIVNQFYDLSHLNGKYNMNDGTMNPMVVKRSDLIPDTYQLSLKAYTDSTGNYMIAGIPYSGQGTTYTIVPLFGTHQFDPISVNRLISASTPTFTVDFTDMSSFPVTGIVYYFNSTVPVPDVKFLIDGKYAQKGNGQLIQTGDDGRFTISVPVGTHEVKAVKSSHVFMNGGKITDRFGHDLDYQKSAGPFTLYDSTSIRLIGRVGGGAVQEAYPLGHSLSRNNLGKVLKIELKLPSGTKYDLYKGNKDDSTIYVDHLLPSNQNDSSKIHKTRVVYDKIKDAIIIYPDSLTGEFVVDLIPVKFIASSVMATGWGNLLDNGSVSLDLTNKFIDQFSVYNYEDSSQTSEGDWRYDQYVDSVAYNYSYQFIKRVTPSLSIIQVNNSQEEQSFFGDSIYTYRTLGGKKQDIAIIDHAKTGRAQYLLGNPVFSQNKPYHFKIKAFEKYPFYASVKPDGTPVVASEDGKPVIDQVPTADGMVSINNSLRNGTTKADTLSLDSTGIGYYDFSAGEPEIAFPGTKDFAASVKFGKAIHINWKWLGTRDKMTAFVTGAKLTGTDFVTAGPNKILMVLRDPPGNKSYSYVQEGSTVSLTGSYSGTLDQVGDIEAIVTVGAKVVTWVGYGAGTITEVDAKTKADITVHHEEHYTGSYTESKSTTFTSRFQTSSDPAFVGAPGDLYVGYSTNITYGKSNNLIIIKRDDLKAADSVIYESSPMSSYLVVNREGINFGQKFGTLFAYPQQHIVKILIPNLINIRNSLLLPPSTSPTEAQQKANNTKTAVYVSRLSSNDPNFGKSNDDVDAFGDEAKTDPVGDGESYKIYFPQSTDYRTDTIMILNQYIHSWQDEIARNEKEKINSRGNLIQNYSFHSGSPVGYSATKNFGYNVTNSFKIVLSAKTVNSTSTKIQGAGVEFKFTESIGSSQSGSVMIGEGSTTTMGFELASDGVDEYLSVDVNAVKGLLPGEPSIFSGFTFQTKGGQTACPYEGANTTLFYNKGAVLDQPTVQIEVPSIKVDNPVVNNVPSTQAAVYTLYLSNESEAHLPATFVLGFANTDSLKGAYIGVDQTSIAGGGRAFSIQYGQTLKKVLILKKGPEAMDYNNIPIILHSSCQYNLTGYQDLIADTVLISAHFVPSCSNVNVEVPQDQWILNTISQVNQQGKRFLPVKLNQFDMSDDLFDHIELQYKPSANSQWITAMNFYGDSARYKAAQGEKAVITNPQGINYNLVMNDASFNDQKYDIRALAVCKLGPGNFISTSSNIISGIKDTYNPRLFGTPEPGNGILSIGEDIRLNFNEAVAAGLLTLSDFKVTGIRNGAQGDHSVAVYLDGQNDFIQTEFDKNFTDKDITAEMWVLPDGKEEGTIFSQGNINASMELAFTADNQLQVIIGQKKIISGKPLNVQPGQWAHVALVYKAADSTISAFYNFQAVIHNVSVPRYTGQGPIDFGRSISSRADFFAGKMHGARIWTQPLAATTLQVNSLTRMSGAEDGLMAYYPMTEGKGTTILDKAHGNNATLIGSWSTPPGKAIAFNGDSYIKMATGTAPITSAMDYTISLWFKAKRGQSDAALVSNGKGDGTDPGPIASRNLFFLGFENGLMTFENNGFKVQGDGNYLDNQWHHVAIAVNRVAGTARLFMDGVLKKYFNTKSLGGIAAANTYLGARVYFTDQDVVTPQFDRYFQGEIDEFRIWNTYLDKAFINRNNNVRLKGDELGLMAYYPFEKYFTFQGQKEMGFTLADQKIQEDPNLHISDAITKNAIQSDDMAPIKDRGPVSNLNFDFVVNNDALIINLLEPKQVIDKTIVTLQTKDVKDLHGNSLVSPITWTAYIDQNPLDWSDDELNLSKDVYMPMQFESYIVNSSGNIQHFTLDNLPAWLTADPSEGNVNPEGKQKINFTVNKGLNVGTYNEIVYMRNDNGETASLSINVKVKGKVPDWKVNPADFQYNMTVYGKIRIDDIFSDDSEDILAAFIHGRCVGLTHNSYFAGQDLWYAFLTVYSDSIKAKDLEFRIWDASSGKIYAGIPSKPVSFVNNSVAGNPDVPVIFDGKEMLFRNIELTKGWNWISFSLINTNLKDVNTALANGSWMSGDIVKHDERGFDQYSVHNGWLGTLDEFDNTSLFKLATGKAQTLSVGGTLPDMKNTPITVRGNRWNYISYLPQINMTLKEALADYKASSGDEIKSQTGFSMYSTTKGWIGNLTFLEPGKGYMLYRKDAANTQFTYPQIGGSLNIHRLAGNSNSIARLNPYQLPVTGNYDFADNMTMIARVGKEFALQPDDKILAYVGNNVRGKAQAINNPVINRPSFFFNISGKQQQSIYFRIERDGKVVARTKPVVSYFPNSRIGSLKEPFILHFKNGSSEDIDNKITIYPNPFNDKINIYVNLKTSSETHKVQMSVWNVAGQLIFKTANKQVSKGYYHTIWNGKTTSGTDCTTGIYFIHLVIDDKSYVYKVMKY